MVRVYVTLIVLLVVGTLAVSLALYPQLPQLVPTHWNIRGEVDGYGNKAWAAFLMPGTMAGLLLLFWAIPWLSPQRFEVDTFRSTFWFVALVITCLLGYIQGLILWAGLSGSVDVTRALLAGVLIMFALIGNVMGKMRRNFWMGVRTPWTLASERVWNDTHRLAAWLFVAAAVMGLICVVLPIPLPAMSITILVLIMSAALLPVLYSLFHYKRLERRGEV
jgi:uncharacterized membrane protein